MSLARDLLTARFGQNSPEHKIFNDEAIARILRRRTHRRYSDQPVPADLLDALLSVAFSASAKSDYQQASVIQVRDPDRRRQIAELIPAMPWIGVSPVFLVFCADANRLQKICDLRGRPTPNQNLEAFFNATVDAALVMQTFILAAEHVGLGCCPISVIRNHLPRVREILSLPERVIPVAGLCVGYPAGEGHISMRLPPRLTRHVDRYDDTDLARELDDYDHRREKVAPTSREKQRAPEKFGYADFYGWSEDKCRQAVAGEGKKFGAMVRASGFSLD
jgi:FMN reductase [NAD(P)H]